MTTEERIYAAKMRLLLKDPFYGQLVQFITFFSEDGIETMGVNHKGNLYYSPKFVEGLTDDQLLAVLKHEILHLAYLHPMRMGTKQQMIWNIAADIKVNVELENDNYNLPDFVIKTKNNSFEFGKKVITGINEKVTEEIYNELLNEAEKLPAPLMKDVLGNGEDDGDVSGSASEWSARVANALDNVRKQQGTAPCGLQREYHEFFNPKIGWKSILKARFHKLGSARSWKKPNKNFLPWYFMSKMKTSGVKCVAAIDTSGSMSGTDLVKGLSELYGLCQQYKHIDMRVMACDAQVWSMDKLTAKSKEKLKTLALKGGGGTDFRPVFDVIHKELKDDVDVLIFFTDLYGDFPSAKPPYDVIWITETDKVDVPFGRKFLIKNM